MKTIEKIKNDTKKIIIVITHDFSIMPIFDSIVLMDKGKLVFQSNHDFLFENNSWYTKGFKKS